MAGNYKSFYESYLQLEKHFASIFTIPSEGGLTSIFFCFKDKIEIKEYQEKFKANREKAEESKFIDFTVVSSFYRGILLKLEDMSEQRKIIEENAKKI